MPSIFINPENKSVHSTLFHFIRNHYCVCLNLILHGYHVTTFGFTYIISCLAFCSVPVRHHANPTWWYTTVLELPLLHKILFLCLVTSFPSVLSMMAKTVWWLWLSAKLISKNNVLYTLDILVCWKCIEFQAKGEDQ